MKKVETNKAVTEQYAMYQKRYRAFIVRHMVWASFNILLGLLPVLICVSCFALWVTIYGLSRAKLIAFALSLLFSIAYGIFIILCLVKDHCKEIAQLQSGRVAVQTGTVMEKTKNRYLIAMSAPARGKKGRSHSVPFLKLFLIPKKNCACDFGVGDQITVVYPATRILQMDGFSGWRAAKTGDAYALYAFMGDKTNDIPPVKWKA